VICFLIATEITKLS